MQVFHLTPLLSLGPQSEGFTSESLVALRSVSCQHSLLVSRRNKKYLEAIGGEVNAESQLCVDQTPRR